MTTVVVDPWEPEDGKVLGEGTVWREAAREEVSEVRREQMRLTPPNFLSEKSFSFGTWSVVCCCCFAVAVIIVSRCCSRVVVLLIFILFYFIYFNNLLVSFFFSFFLLC